MISCLLPVPGFIKICFKSNCQFDKGNTAVIPKHNVWSAVSVGNLLREFVALIREVGCYMLFSREMAVKERVDNIQDLVVPLIESTHPQGIFTHVEDVL